jgi:hypothetical protein
MNVKDRMSHDEAELKVIVDRISAAIGVEPVALLERDCALQALAAKLVEMRTFVDDCLGGRSEQERNVLQYKIRIEFPLFSHLDSLASMSGEFVDWSARDFSLTPASEQ